jgi:hypothetical protein
MQFTVEREIWDLDVISLPMKEKLHAVVWHAVAINLFSRTAANKLRRFPIVKPGTTQHAKPIAGDK